MRNTWNHKAYNRLAFEFIKLILSEDGFTIVSADTDQFDDSDLDGYDEIGSLPIPEGLAKGVAFAAKNDQGKSILFCFYDESNVDALRLIAGRVFDYDKDKFHTLCYLIVRTHDEIMECRKAGQADNWPRGFFVEFNELLNKAGEMDKNRFGYLRTLFPGADSDFRSREKIDHFKAEVLERIPVGGNGDPGHFLLRFEARQLEHIVPGQFVMIDTLPYGTRKKIDMRRPVRFFSNSGDSSSRADIPDLNPVSFLKRPFSIHSAYYRYFELGYLKNMCLPSTLAMITHTVFPHRFEIFFKLIENGIGTNELKQMKKGDTFQMLGPLGKKPDVAKWRSDSIEEVHLIGGGVGMAPLMFFGQALKYYSFRIKAFIGIDRIETLREAPLGKTFEDDPGKAYVYIDNLRSVGLSNDDIYISFDKAVRDGSIDLGLSGQNCFPGLVSEQYKAFLDRLDQTSGILVLACGPTPMLKALEKITSKAKIPMKVLLEKRMGCGIGVCMSCACRTRKNNGEQYSRVCTDGPLFDAGDIVWEEI